MGKKGFYFNLRLFGGDFFSSEGCVGDSLKSWSLCDYFWLEKF